MSKQKPTKKERFMFWGGIIFGLCGGVIGNILVNSAFNLMNNSCKNNICYYGSIALMFLSFIVFIVLIYFVLTKLNKITKK